MANNVARRSIEAAWPELLDGQVEPLLLSLPTLNGRRDQDISHLGIDSPEAVAVENYTSRGESKPGIPPGLHTR